MPAIIAAALFEVGTVGYAVVYAVVSVALSVGLSKLSQALSGSQKPSNSGLQNQARDVTIRGTVVPEQAVYGQVRTGGTLGYANLTGTINETLVYVIVWAGHQCDSIVEYQLDNFRIKRSDLSGVGPIYTVTHPHFVNRGINWLKIEEHLGTSTQTVSTQLTAADISWDSTHKGAGLCYSIFYMTFDSKVWANGAPTNVYAVVKGRKLYDPRLDSTNGGSGSQRANDATTWSWSNNWALVIRDVVSGGSITYDVATPNKKLLGGGELDARIDDAYTIAAANHADESCTTPIPCLSGTVKWTNGSPVITGTQTQFTYEFPGGTIKLLGPDSNFYTILTVDSDTQITLTGNYTGTTTLNATTQWNTTTSTTTTEFRFTADYLCSLDQTRGAILNALLTAGIGHLSYTGGKYRIFAGVYDSPTVTLQADDIVGPMDTTTSPEGEDAYNSVGGTFYDEQRGWAQQSFPNQTQSSYQTDDGDLYTRNVDLLATRGYYRAQRIGNVILQQSRNKTTVTFSKLAPKAFQIGEWETFNVNISEYGWVNQVFRCIEWTFLPDGFISIVGRIEGSSLYSDLASGNYQLPRNITSGQGGVMLPSAPTALAITPQPGAISFVVTGSFTSDTTIELWEHTSSSPFSSATLIAEGIQTIFTIYKGDMTLRYYWVRSRLNGQVSSTFPASTGSGGQAALSSFVARGNCVVSGSNAQKIGGAGAWDSDVYSINGYKSCHVAFKNDTTTAAVMVGLNTDPVTDQSYSSIDYAWYCDGGGGLHIYVNGSDTGVVAGSYTIATVLAIVYDGTNVVWLKDGVSITGLGASGLTLFADSSFFDNGGIHAFRFGPTTNLDAVDNTEIRDGAISPAPVSSSPSDSTLSYASVTQPVIESAGISATASLTPSVTTGTSRVDVTWSTQAKIDVTTSGAAAGISVVTITIQVNGSTVFTKQYSIEGTASIGDYVTVAGATNVSVPAGQTVDAFFNSGRVFSSGGVSPAQVHSWKAAHLSVQAAMR